MTPTTTTNDTVISRVRNYEGSNTFILKMKDTIKRWGNLTQKQLEAVEKCLNSRVEVKVEELSEEMQKIAKYEGVSTFVLDIKRKLMEFGTLTENQKSTALRTIQKEDDKKRTFELNIPTVGETIKVGRTIGQGLREKYGLKFNPILLDVTKVSAISPKAVKFEAKMTVKRGDVCMCCAKTLTDEFSMLTRMGKQCAGHMGVEYIKDASQAERFREEYLKKVDEIGVMEVWVPKSKIVKWEGKTEVILKMI
jgi:hypothetical protein